MGRDDAHCIRVTVLAEVLASIVAEPEVFGVSCRDLHSTTSAAMALCGQVFLKISVCVHMCLAVEQLGSNFQLVRTQIRKV